MTPRALTRPFTAEVSLEHSKTQRVASRWNAPHRSTIAIREHIVHADQPRAVGGEDTGPAPMELILGGVEACTSVVIANVARELSIPLHGIDTYTIARQDVRGMKGEADVQPYFHTVRLQLVLATAQQDADALAELAACVERRCPALNLLKDANIELTCAWAAAETLPARAAEQLANAALGYQNDAPLTAPVLFWQHEQTTHRTPAPEVNAA